MRKYPVEHWKALGEWVSAARHQAGYSDTEKWAAEVGRSTRMLLGLERGEQVGPKTIEAIAEALGVANWSLFDILHEGKRQSPWSDANPEEARARYERETGLEADDGASDLLTGVTDEDLLAELGRRLSTRPLSRTERRLQEIRARWHAPEHRDLVEDTAAYDGDPDDQPPSDA